MRKKREGKAPPHDDEADEPLGPATPDSETDLGDTPEAHDELTPHHLPKDHPGRHATSRRRAPRPRPTTSRPPTPSPRTPRAATRPRSSREARTGRRAATSS